LYNENNLVFFVFRYNYADLAEVRAATLQPQRLQPQRAQRAQRKEEYREESGGGLFDV
jgi:hypothetical protein